MKMRTITVASAILVAFIGFARADDHLFQAEQHGLGDNTHSQVFTVNPADHSGELAPGQGSPFTGSDTKTPATDTDAANTHANVKPR
jgi:hypothetical protein